MCWYVQIVYLGLKLVEFVEGLLDLFFVGLLFCWGWQLFEGVGTNA